MKTLYIVCIICIICSRTIKGYCLYGDDSECAFQCHCAVDSESSGGRCPSGCYKSSPSGYKWGGPACQIGNIGLGKSTNMTASDYYQKRYPATGALDGIIPPVLNASCAHLSNDDGSSAEWWTDLGDVYKIYNITIYARKDVRDDRLQQFTLTVYNTSDNEVVCGYHQDPVYTHVTVTCSRPLIGQYVHFKRRALGSNEAAPICEIVIIGHRYIDCNQCPVGIKCNDVTGCETCYGAYQPDCKQKCEAGFYGRNCEERCGNCKTNTVCDRYNGTCLDGCQIWWTDIKCNTYIELPNQKQKKLTVVKKTSNSIEISWEPIDGISSNLRSFYGYLIEYKDGLSDANFTDVGTVSYKSNPNWILVKLEMNAVYQIKVITFRRYGNIQELGTPYEILLVKTKSNDFSSSLNKTLLTVSAVFDVIFIVIIVVLSILLWKSRQKLRTHMCDNLNMRTTESAQRRGYINASEGREVHENNDDIIQYEDVMANVNSETKDTNNYEGLSPEGIRIYQNNLMAGPYAELKQN